MFFFSSFLFISLEVKSNFGHFHASQTAYAKNTIHFAVYNSQISKNCVALCFYLTLHFFYNPQIKVSAQNSYIICRLVNVFLKYILLFLQYYFVLCLMQSGRTTS